MYETYKDYRDAWDKAYKECPPVPLCVDIELASACNLFCTFCAWGESKFAKKMKQQKSWDGKPSKRFMPKEMAFKLIDECAEMGVPSIKWNVKGESTLHPDFSDIVEYARGKTSPHEEFLELTDYSFHDLLINTNANCPDGSIDGLMACTKVMVSLDSMEEETYDKIRIGGKLGEAVKTINQLVLRNHPNVWVRRVICKTNKDEDFVSAVKAHWGDSVKVSQHYAFDRNQDEKQSIYESDPKNWARQYCGYPSQRVVVNSDGTFSPCCLAWRNEFAMSKYGTGIGDMTLKEYWNGIQRETLVSQLRKNVFKNDLCKNCTSFMSYKRPEREFVQDVEAK